MSKHFPLLSTVYISKPNSLLPLNGAQFAIKALYSIARLQVRSSKFYSSVTEFPPKSSSFLLCHFVQVVYCFDLYFSAYRTQTTDQETVFSWAFEIDREYIIYLF